MIFTSVDQLSYLRIPNTYPNVPPIIQFKDPFGLSKDTVAALSKKVHCATESLLGREMILEIAQIVAEHVTDHHHVAHLSTSLNEEMETRTEELQKVLFLSILFSCHIFLTSGIFCK